MGTGGRAGGGGGAGGAVGEAQILPTSYANQGLPPASLERRTTFDISRNEAKRAHEAIGNDPAIGTVGSVRGPSAPTRRLGENQRQPRVAYMDLKQPFATDVGNQARSVMRKLQGAGYSSVYHPLGGESLNVALGRGSTPRIYLRKVK